MTVPDSKFPFSFATVMNIQVVPNDLCKPSLEWQFLPSHFCRAHTRLCRARTRLCFNLSKSTASLPTCIKSIKSPQKSSEHTTLLVQTFLERQRLKTLMEKLRRKSNPVQILKDEGDWNREEFWAVLSFLKETSQMKEALQVFDLWTRKETSRINEANYTKIIQLLGEAGLMEEATVKLHEMKNKYRLNPSIEAYNFIIHGYAAKGQFGEAKHFLEQLMEHGLVPDSETYNGLIQAYGNHKMYDEMVKCMKRMETSEHSFPDHVTYNILIRELARAGLLERMESAYRTVLSKHLNLHFSTLIAMLEAYTDLGLLGKMERIFQRILISKALPREGLIRKIAEVLIENYRFSRLEELSLEICSVTGKTDLVWYLLLLSQACMLSRRGMESVVCEMREVKVQQNVTMVNMIALAYLKMKDLRSVDRFLCKFRWVGVKPDIVTVGVVIDVCLSGFDGIGALEAWGRMGFLDEVAEMNTDPLVLTAFQKGKFLRTCEELFSSLGSKAMEKKVWTYRDLIHMVFNQDGTRLLSLRTSFQHQELSLN